MANYDLKPRLNRQPGVSTVVVQGGKVPEFQVQPDPAKLVQTGVTVPNILDAIGRSNMIDSPGLIEENHQLVLEPGERPDADAGGNRQHRHQDHARPARPCASATSPRSRPSVMPVYTIVTANAKPAVLLNINRQPDSNTVAVANAVHAEIAQIQQGAAQGRRAAARSTISRKSSTTPSAACATPSCWGWCWPRSSWCCSCAIGARRWWPAW